MKKIFTIFIILTPYLGLGQNPPNCDLLTIDCCTVFNGDSDSLALYVSNADLETELFTYPGFILLDTDGDTIAMEIVNYFGIGSYPHLHYLKIMNPFELPFTGTLEVHTLFYDSLHCVFPIVIEETTSIEDQFSNEDIVQIYPNPCTDLVYLEFKEITSRDNYQIQVFQEDGQFIFDQKVEQQRSYIPVSELRDGNIYFIQVLDNGGKIIATEKLIKY